MPGNVGNINPANWPPPNYINPVHRGWMPAYAGSLFALGTLMVATRLTLRLMKKAGSLGIDDLCLGIGWLAGIMFTALTILVTTKYDVSRHVWDVRLYNFENILRTVWMQEFAFLICGASTKIAVLLFYRRLVEGTYSKKWKYAVYAAIGFTVMYSLAFLLALIFNCTPTEAYWKAYDPFYSTKYTCVDTTSINVLAGLAAAVSDLYSVALPCAMTWTFQMPTKQKIALNLVFCLGLLVVIASSVRTYYLWEVGHKGDVSWILFDVMIWSQLELQLAMMCASAPAIRVLFRTYLNPSVSRLRSGSSQNHHSTDKSSSAPELNRMAPRRISDPESRPNRYDRRSMEVEIRYSPPARHADLYTMDKKGDNEVYTLQELKALPQQPPRSRSRPPFRRSFFR